jgi:hypothetical protein
MRFAETVKGRHFYLICTPINVVIVMDFALFIFVLKAATAQDIPHEDTT